MINLFIKKIIEEINELDIYIERNENQYPLEDACDYIMNKIDNDENINIEEVKNLLKDYSLKSELIEEDHTIDLKIYDYTFSNGDMESIKITTYVENNKETISYISHFIGKFTDNSNLVLSFESQTDVSVSYYTSDRTTYKKAWEQINKVNN